MKKLLPFILFSYLLAGCGSINFDENLLMENVNDFTMIPTNEQTEKRAATLPNTNFWPETPKQTMIAVTLTEVLSDNTLLLSDGNKYFLSGIDPTGDTQTERRPMYKVNKEEVYSFLIKLLSGKTLYVEVPKGEKPTEKAAPAYIWIGDSEELKNVNALLIKEGLVKAVRQPPVSMYDKTFKDLENEALVKKKGIWQ